MSMMTLPELAQYTYQGLKRENINVTLSGGACVSIYTHNAYQSIDLDFIRDLTTSIEEVATVMKGLGFKREGRKFTHLQSEFYVEFPPPPLTVGEEPPRQLIEKELRTALGNLAVKMLSPTDCVKDRLCAYFHWNDLQSLDQAIMVCRNQEIDLPEVERWALHEGMGSKHQDFLAALKNKNR